MIVTGGGPGIMEAANRGAYDVGAKSVGLNIRLPHEQQPNPYITPDLCFQFHYFAMRKLHFLLRAKALVAFPGGFGTLDELFDALTLRQTGRMQAIPIILFGREYWQRVIDFQFLADQGTMADEDLDLLSYAETAAEIWQIIRGRERMKPREFASSFVSPFPSPRSPARCGRRTRSRPAWSRKMVRPASTASTLPPAAVQRFQRAQSDGGHVETHVLLRLGHFDHREAAGRTERAGAADALVGPFDGLDRQHGLVLDGHALADVEPAHLLGDLPAELDVFLLPGRRAAAGKLSFGHEQLRCISRWAGRSGFPPRRTPSTIAPSSESSRQSFRRVQKWGRNMRIVRRSGRCRSQLQRWNSRTLKILPTIVTSVTPCRWK